MKKQKGITLVALIITIAIMLILVGVSIRVVVDSGILKIAKDAGSRTKGAYENEQNTQIIVGGTEKTIEEILNGTSATGSPCILETSKGENLKNYEIYGNSVQSNLPQGYTELEYIESSGTQYIDTSFIPNNNTITKIKFSQTIDGGNGAILGARVTNQNDYRIQVSMSSDTTTTTIQRIFGNQIEGFFSNYYNWTKDTIYDVEFGRNVYINDTLINTFNDIAFTSERNMYLFCFNANGIPTTISYSKIYNCKIYNNDIIVRNMIPCKRNSDNAIGMYDTVNNVFYTNAGTGTFVAGAEIEPTPDNPISIYSLGENGEIEVKSSNGTETLTTTIDLTGHEPLRKIGDVADYIDYANSRIVRNFTKVDLGTLTWTVGQYTTGYYATLTNPKRVPNPELFKSLCDISYVHTWKGTLLPLTYAQVEDTDQVFFKMASNFTLSEWQEFTSDHYLIYQLATPVYEPITLPQIPTLEGTTVLTATDENLSASNINVKYVN